MVNLLLLFFLLAGCVPPVRVLSAATPVDTPATAPTLTPSATASPSPAPSATRRPTATPTPTLAATRRPTATPTLAAPPVLGTAFPGARMKGRVGFGSDWQANWFLSDAKAGRVGADEVFYLFGRDGAVARLGRNTQYAAGQGLVFDFKFTPGAVCRFSLENGQPATYDYRQFSVVGCASSYISLTNGETRTGLRFIGGNMALQPDTWYNLALGVAGDGQFILHVWDKADPHRYLDYQEKLGFKWNSLTWRFSAQVDGVGQVLELREVEEFGF